jgi:long-chain fatty acid transport protein
MRLRALRQCSTIVAVLPLAVYCSTDGWRPGLVRADGIRNPFQSPAAIGQGNAFTAQADLPSAVFYNPAGLTQLRGVQIETGIEFVNVRTRFEGEDGTGTENDLGGLIGWPPPGQAFVAAHLPDLGLERFGDLSVGLGVLNLFGFAARYPEDSPLRTVVTEASLPLLAIKPTVAYRLTEWLSLGLGADIFTFADFIGEGHVEQKFVWAGGLDIPAGSKIEINGTGTAVGMNASLLLTALRGAEGKPRLNFGLVWRSQVDLTVEGDLLANGVRVAGAKSTFRFPMIWNLGAAFWPVRDKGREWKLEIDMDIAEWSVVKNLDVTLSNGATLQNPQEWSNAVTVWAGGEYRWLGPPVLPAWDLAARAGYGWSMSPIADVSFNPAAPDSNIHMFTVGMGATCRLGGRFFGLIRCGGGGALRPETIGIDLAYQLLYYEPRHILTVAL